MKKFICLTLLLAVALLLTGCGVYTNYKDIEQLQIIQTLGVDRLPDGGVRLSVSSGSDAGERSPTLLCIEDTSILTAMEHLQEYSPRESLYFPHAKSLLLGQDTARAGLAEFLDYVQRSSALPSELRLYLLREAKAETLITGSGDEQYDVSDELAALLRDAERQDGFPVPGCMEVLRSLTENGAALVYAIAPAESEGVIFAGGGGLSLLSAGYGILKGDRLVGLIPPEDAPAVALLLGQLSGKAVTLPVLGSRVTFRPRRGEVHLVPHWEAGRLGRLTLTGELSAVAAELETPALLREANFLPEAEAALESWASEALLRVLRQSARLGADCFSLGQRLRRQAPRRFDALSRPWEETLGDLTFDIDLKVELEGDKEPPPPLTGEEARP